MTTNKKVRGKAVSMPKGLAIGTAVAMLLTILFAVGMTQLILAEKIEEKVLGYGGMILLPLASAVSALIATGIIKRKRMQVCLLSGLTFFLMLGSVNVVFFGGRFRGVGVSIILIALGVLCVAMLGLRGERHNGKRQKKYRTR